MDLNSKKENILRCVKLGMHFYQAALVAECSEEEIEEIERDELFKRKVSSHHAFEEYRLLQKHNTAIEEAVLRGNAAAIQWKLERLNPERWGNKETVRADHDVHVEVSLVGKNPDGSTS